MDANLVRAPLAISVFGGVLFVSACNSEITCKDACACEGLAEDKLCLEQCETDRSATKAKAEAAHCSAQQADFTLCAADNASCDSVKKQYAYPVEACKAESDKLSKCSASSTSTGSN